MTIYQPQLLGVLGGMGPMATVDFLAKLTRATPANCDQEHIPIVVRFCPQIPDRSEAIEGRGLSPRIALENAAIKIESDGAQALVIPCNTAHFWYEQIPVGLRSQPIGLLATKGTLQSAVYQSRYPSINWVIPSRETIEDKLMPAIRHVKAGNLLTAGTFLNEAIEQVRDAGAASIVLGCTELPLAYQLHHDGMPVVDATEALALSAVRWALRGQRDLTNPREVSHGNFLA
jgi:aspartate racemase